MLILGFDKTRKFIFFIIFKSVVEPSVGFATVYRDLGILKVPYRTVKKKRYTAGMNSTRNTIVWDDYSCVDANKNLRRSNTYTIFTYRVTT